MQLSLTDRRHCEGVSADAQVSPCHRRVSCQSPGDKADQPRVQEPSCVAAHHLAMLLLVLLGLAALCQVPSPAADIIILPLLRVLLLRTQPRLLLWKTQPTSMLMPRTRLSLPSFWSITTSCLTRACLSPSRGACP